MEDPINFVLYLFFLYTLLGGHILEKHELDIPHE